MFKRSTTDRPAEMVSIFLDGEELKVRSGDTVAAAILAHGTGMCRTSVVSETPRGPYCMMGVCFDCLVIIDGMGSRQACMTPVRAGMRVERQNGRRELGR